MPAINCIHCKDLGKSYLTGSDKDGAFCGMCAKGVNMLYDTQVASIEAKRTYSLRLIFGSAYRPQVKPEFNRLHIQGHDLLCSNPSCDQKSKVSLGGRDCYIDIGIEENTFDVSAPNVQLKGNDAHLMVIFGCMKCGTMTYKSEVFKNLGCSENRKPLIKIYPLT